MDKRLELLKLIINSDDEGIKVIWNHFYGKKNMPFSEEDLMKSAASAFVDMVHDHVGVVLISDELAEFACRIAKNLFKEEK